MSRVYGTELKSFPEKFTLILGNEEKGISQAALKEADVFLTIPLTGEQKSLNVASAFAMAAFQIKKKVKFPLLQEFIIISLSLSVLMP